MNKNSPISKHVINVQRVRLLYRHEIRNESGYEVGIDDAFTNKSQFPAP